MKNIMMINKLAYLKKFWSNVPIKIDGEMKTMMNLRKQIK